MPPQSSSGRGEAGGSRISFQPCQGLHVPASPIGPACAAQGTLSKARDGSGGDRSCQERRDVIHLPAAVDGYTWVRTVIPHSAGMQSIDSITRYASHSSPTPTGPGQADIILRLPRVLVDSLPRRTFPTQRYPARSMDAMDVSPVSLTRAEVSSRPPPHSFHKEKKGHPLPAPTTDHSPRRNPTQE